MKKRREAFRKWEQTKVIFRKWKSTGEVIALFPEIKNGPFCLSYMRIGQHGDADYNLVVQLTKPAYIEECGALYDELTQIGYKLVIRKRR